MKNNVLQPARKIDEFAPKIGQKGLENNFSDNGSGQIQEKKTRSFLGSFGLSSHKNGILSGSPIALDNFYNKIFSFKKADSRKRLFGIVIFGGQK